MATEFVAILDGNEVDWVDPVIEFSEHEEYWRIDNGFSVYLITRQPGMTYKIRAKEVAP